MAMKKKQISDIMPVVLFKKKKMVCSTQEHFINVRLISATISPTSRILICCSVVLNTLISVLPYINFPFINLNFNTIYSRTLFTTQQTRQNPQLYIPYTFLCSKSLLFKTLRNIYISNQHFDIFLPDILINVFLYWDTLTTGFQVSVRVTHCSSSF